MRAPALLGLVVLIHAAAIGALALMQGCATRRPGEGMGGVPAATERATTDTPASSTHVAAQEFPPATVNSRSGTLTPLPPKRSAAKPETPVAHAPRPAPIKPASTPATLTPAPRKALPTEGTPYEIKPGDSLSKIAVAHGVSTLELAGYNGISNPGSIRAGQKIMIPPGAKAKAPATVAASTLTPATASKSAPHSTSSSTGAGEYKVQAGDILGRIASRHGTTVAAIKKANNLTSENIRIGQVLKIPGAAPAPTPVATATPAATLTPASPVSTGAPVVTTPEVVTAPQGIEPVVISPVTPVKASDTAFLAEGSKPFEYTVPSGETLEDIARMFIVTPDAIRKLNGLGSADTIQAGQRIKIPPSQY